jgi:hypothetical protein
MKVSFFNSITSTAPKVSKDVSFFLDRIKEGKSKDLVSDIRSTTDESKQQELKRKLPVVCFGGYFSNRSKAGLKKSSGLMVLDFDHVKDLESSTNLRDELSKDPFVFSAWVLQKIGL